MNIANILNNVNIINTSKRTTDINNITEINRLLEWYFLSYIELKNVALNITDEKINFLIKENIKTRIELVGIRKRIEAEQFIESCKKLRIG